MSNIIGIVAIDRRGAIGRGGALPWHYSADLKFFKRRTTGNVCVMGYRTWLSLRKPLPERLNVVLSRASRVEPQESVVLLRDKMSVLSLKKYLACDIYVIGGAEVFRSFLLEIDRWLITEIPLTVEDADTFMPADFLRGFALRDTEEIGDDLKVSTYERIQNEATT
ncbi:MAG TPA: dihydrofolate reductase [Pyrinomonadaceae bacterium]|jgi:dihydrofolate reductase|nr:dihydrofolate reductase [Pyrinomonadaceae bacterium]